MKRRKLYSGQLALVAASVLLVATWDLVAQPLVQEETQGMAPRHRAEVANPFKVQFQDVTREAGIHFHHERAASPEKLYLETMGAGVAWIDYNQDGYLDALFVNSGYTPFFHPEHPPQPALYRNNRDGTFTDVTITTGIRTYI
jgi:hypothetical protein